MSAVWTRLMLEPLPVGSAAFLRRAQRYCYPLRRVRVLDAQADRTWFGEEYERVEILAPPDLIAIWNAPIPGEWSLVRVAAGYLLGLAEAAAEQQPGHIPF